MDIRFCIGVATHNRPRDLHKLLKAIEVQLIARANFRMVVVNDGSHSNEYQQVINEFSNLIEYRILPQNVGPGLARHAAFEDANEEYLICTDDDCLPPPNWLSWLEAIVAANHEADLFAGIALPQWTKKAGIFQKLLTVPNNYPHPIFSENGLMTAVGANSIFRNEAYRRAGGYSSEMSGAVEDCWLTQKMLNTGSSYTLLHSANTGHKAETGMRALWRRFHWYGMGGAQYAILEQDWILAKMGSGPFAKDCRKNIKRKISAEWNSTDHGEGRWLKRLAYSAITAWTSFAYERGWRKGVGKYTTKYNAKLPAPPSAYEQFVNFGDERSALVALGEKS